MAQDNNRPGSSPDAPGTSDDLSDGSLPDTSASTTVVSAPPAGALPAAARTSVGLTPGQRLAAKQAQKAVDKREFKEDLKRKEDETRQKEQAEADKLFGRPQVDGGLPPEVAKASATFSDFLHANSQRILAGVAALVVLGAVGLGVQKLLRAGAADQAKALGAALEIANARVDPDAKSDKGDDGKPIFKTPLERAAQAATAFASVAKEGEEGAGAWALLGQAASEVELGKFDDAKQHFQRVHDANKGNPQIAARALEGVGVALEGAGKPDEARATYESLKQNASGKQLAELHLARLALAKGDRETGKALLKGLYDALKNPADSVGTSRYLKSEVEIRLAEIDSTLVSRQPSGPAVFDPSGLGDPSKMSEEQIKKLIESLQKGQGAPPPEGSE